MRTGNSRCRRLFHIDGIGVDLNRFHPVPLAEKNRLRESLGLRDTDFVILYTAEFIPRKNHLFLLREIPVLRQSIPELHILFAGKGELLESCRESAAELRVAEIVHFLGYRDDVELLCQMADLHVSPSRQEGLAVSNIEAMASGLPLVCSRIRGAVDVIIEGRNGLFFELNDPAKMVKTILTLYKTPELRETIARINVTDAKKFSVDTAMEKMADIYKQFM
ncbi:MAG: glycosyltransferase [Treponema sp.]|nr:glycosyltransferase [Treponema sp.]